ncbi:hypothetical protein L6452_42883 [Arctium lappa]|uniref:Uncharacterized protein n=1 Tax=Arctium lappa TaxID=4217 RepID=A0ACB8XK65_ARCLA|nr:hypothetical protein L6452_42883 [Arctium lappa]
MSSLTKPTTLLLLLIFFFFFLFISISTNPSLVYRCGLASKLQDSHLYFQFQAISKKETTSYWTTTAAAAASRKRKLSGPGSSPPRCAWKCGRCTPCKPVHIPVPPGTPVTAEYYPEAWRCKCGNKLYMP